MYDCVISTTLKIYFIIPATIMMTLILSTVLVSGVQMRPISQCIFMMNDDDYSLSMVMILNKPMPYLPTGRSPLHGHKLADPSHVGPRWTASAFAAAVATRCARHQRRPCTHQSERHLRHHHRKCHQHLSLDYRYNHTPYRTINIEVFSEDTRQLWLTSVRT